MSSELKPPLKGAKGPTPAEAKKLEPVYVSLEKRQAFTVERAPKGWSFVTVTYTDDGTIDKIEKSPADLKPIIANFFK